MNGNLVVPELIPSDSRNPYKNQRSRESDSQSPSTDLLYFSLIPFVNFS